MIKVAILTTVIDFGGAEKAILHLIKKLSKRQFELVPIIFTSSNNHNNLFFEILCRMKKKYNNVITDDARIKYWNPVKNMIEAHNIIKSN